VVRFEPVLENTRDKRLFAMRVIQIVEPIKYAAVFEYQDAVTEGSLLHNPKNGEIVTVNIDRYRGLGLLWPKQTLGLSSPSTDVFMFILQSFFAGDDPHP
jgi:hypothetical protein